MGGYNRQQQQNRKASKPKRIKEKFVEERQHRAPPIVAKTQNQKYYLGRLRTEKLIVCSGPSGSGKTFIPSALAADALIRQEIDKIVVARPYVSMGKSIGLRPGDDYMKLYGFVRPMLDTIQKRMGKGAYDIALSRGDIEVQALDSIRGRSFDDRVCLIVDELQNATPEEIKSIVTRLGEGCQMIGCGDPDQTDIKGENGIQYLERIISTYNIQDAAVVKFTEEDIVRSSIAKDFVIAFRKEKNK